MHAQHPSNTIATYSVQAHVSAPTTATLTDLLKLVMSIKNEPSDGGSADLGVVPQQAMQHGCQSVKQPHRGVVLHHHVHQVVEEQRKQQLQQKKVSNWISASYQSHGGIRG